MVDARYKNGDLVRWYRSKMVKVDESTEDALDVAGQAGEKALKDNIQTRGTGRTWSYPRDGRAGSFPGRVNTGTMLNAAKYRIQKRGASKQLRVGWVSGVRKDYFKFQEGGFEHPSGVTVEGMHAVQDATEEAFNVLAEELKERLRREN